MPEEEAPQVRAGMGWDSKQGNGLCKGTEAGKGSELISCCGRASTARTGQTGHGEAAEKGGGQTAQPAQAVVETAVSVITSVRGHGPVSRRDVRVSPNSSLWGSEGQTAPGVPLRTPPH